jgi:UDP-N-acetyl-D-glucosamine dehydrogenase
VHVLGVAYKKNIDDVRESPALDILHLLNRRGASVSYSDPYILEVKADSVDLRSVPELEACAQADCVVIVTDHNCFDYAAVLERAPLIVDTRNAMKRFSSPKIVRL